MICSECNFENSTDATYCESCGEKLIALDTDQDNSDEVIMNNETLEQEENTVFVPISPVSFDNSTTEGDAEKISNHAVADPSRKNKTENKGFIAVIAIVICVALIVGLGIILRYKFLKLVNPERYLQVSLGRTFSDKSDMQLIDMSKYADQAVEYEFSVESEGVGADISVLYDAGAEKALFEMLFDNGTQVYDDNLMYISRELIAISFPELFNDATFLTIDPDTFADDIEELGTEPSLPSDYIDEALDMFFGKSEDGEKDLDEVAAYYREAKFLEDFAEFSHGKSVTEKINGKRYKLDAMSYVISEDDANDYLQDALGAYKQGFFDSMGYMYQGYELETSQEAFDSAFDVFSGIKIKGDIIITYYVDRNDFVRIISVDEFELSMVGESGDLAIEFEMLLGGKNNPTDDISAILTLSAEGEEVELGMDWEQSFERGVFKREIEVFIDGERKEEYLSATFEMEWDTKDKKGDNFEAVLSFGGENGFVIEVTGALTDGKSETTFKDGKLRIDDGYSENNIIDFECSISMIDPKDISIDLEDSMSLFDYIEKIEEQSMQF